MPSFNFINIYKLIAVWLLAESPGPIFNVGNGINALSEVVGEPCNFFQVQTGLYQG
jgi:hypothetical protein